MQSLDLKQKILNVNSRQGRKSEIFPLKKNVRVESLNGKKMKLKALRPGTTVLIYFNQKRGERTIKNIIVLSPGEGQANKPAPSLKSLAGSGRPPYHSMKIGITCYPTYGGSGVVATELGLELAARGHDIHFISYAVPVRMAEPSERLHFHEVEVMNYPLFDHPPYTLALASQMYNVAVNESLDLLHVHYAIPHSVSAFLARSMLGARRIPVVTTLHGTDITLVGSDRSYLPITRFAIEQSDAATAISDYLRQVTLTEFGISRPIEVIPNFVNCDVFHPQEKRSRRQEFAAQGEKILVHLSNFRPVKRVTDVVEILRGFGKKFPLS